MLRSAAKNHAHVVVATDPAQYQRCWPNSAATTARSSATAAFALSVAASIDVAQYDARIGDYLRRTAMRRRDGSSPASATATSSRSMDLRYGENPHQQAAFYRDLRPSRRTLATFEQLQGKELRYNNIADADAAWECVRQFARRPA